MDIRTGDLIFVKGSGIIADAIEEITHSPYSHVAGLISPNTLLEAQGLRKVGTQSLFSYSGFADVYTCDELTDDQRLLIAWIAKKSIGHRYSYSLIAWELLRYTLGVTFMPKKDWQPIICSTLWADAYRKAGIDLCPNIRFPTPGDLYISKKLLKVGVL